MTKTVKKTTKKTKPAKKSPNVKPTERDAQDCHVKHVFHDEYCYKLGGDTPLQLDVYQAEDGDYKGEFIGIVSRRIQQTKSCKTIEEVRKEAGSIADIQGLIVGITGKW
jgi:hypothetical protein